MKITNLQVVENNQLQVIITDALQVFALDNNIKSCQLERICNSHSPNVITLLVTCESHAQSKKYILRLQRNLQTQQFQQELTAIFYYSNVNITPALVYTNNKNNLIIMDYIYHDTNVFDNLSDIHINKLANLIRKIHVPITHFSEQKIKSFIYDPMYEFVIKTFAELLKKHKNLAIYKQAFNYIKFFQQLLQPYHHSYLTHRDLHPGNILFDKHTENFYAIDWESLSIGDPFFDLATVSCFLRFNKAQEKLFLLRYLQTKHLTLEQTAHYQLMKTWIYLFYSLGPIICSKDRSIDVTHISKDDLPPVYDFKGLLKDIQPSNKTPLQCFQISMMFFKAGFNFIYSEQFTKAVVTILTINWHKYSWVQEIQINPHLTLKQSGATTMKIPFFVALEGGQGSGKTTQIEKLKNFFTAIVGKDDFIVTRANNTKLRPHVEKLISVLEIGDLTQDDNFLPMTFLYQALLTVTARRIKQLLENGKFVVVDRWRDSYVVCNVKQKPFNEFDSNFNLTLENHIFNSMEADVRILLDITPEIAKQRISLRNRQDIVKTSHIDYMRDIRYKFLEQFRNSGYIINVDNKSPDMVFSEIIKIIRLHYFLKQRAMKQELKYLVPSLQQYFLAATITSIPLFFLNSSNRQLLKEYFGKINTILAEGHNKLASLLIILSTNPQVALQNNQILSTCTIKNTHLSQHTISSTDKKALSQNYGINLNNLFADWLDNTNSVTTFIYGVNGLTQHLQNILKEMLDEDIQTASLSTKSITFFASIDNDKFFVCKTPIASSTMKNQQLSFQEINQRK